MFLVYYPGPETVVLVGEAQFQSRKLLQRVNELSGAFPANNVTLIKLYIPQT